MKKLLYLPVIIVFILQQSCMVSKQPRTSFFDNPYYDFGNAKFTSINVPVFLAKPFVKKALRDEKDSEEVIALVKGIKKVKVLTVENADPKMLSDYSRYLEKNKYEDWATVKHEGQKVNIRALQNGDVIEKLMIILLSDRDMIFVDVKGKFTPQQISDLINENTREELAASRRD